jgi:ferredoxin-NADP reductase
MPNTSFRGPEHLWVEWDPAQNPERANPPCWRRATRCASANRPARVGRTLVVSAARSHGAIRLAAPDGRAAALGAGSHIDVECGDTGISRQYSLCGPTISAYSRSPCCAKRKAAAVRGFTATCAGDRVKVRGPRNHFRLDETCRKAIFIAGGIGVTPISAMARRAKALGIDYVIHYCGRSRTAMALLDELAALHGARLRAHVAATKASAPTSRNPRHA